jgi:hypothetical protein
MQSVTWAEPLHDTEFKTVKNYANRVNSNFELKEYLKIPQRLIALYPT